MENETLGLAALLRLGTLVFLGVIVPQVLGVFAFWSLPPGTRWAKRSTVWIAPVTYYVITSTFWGQQAADLRARDVYVCGMFGMMSLFTTFFGAMAHFLVAAFLLPMIGFLRIRRRNSALPEGHS